MSILRSAGLLQTTLEAGAFFLGMNLAITVIVMVYGPYMLAHEAIRVLMSTSILDDLEVGIRKFMHGLVDFIWLMFICMLYAATLTFFVHILLGLVVLAVLMLPIRLVSPKTAGRCTSIVLDGASDLLVKVLSMSYVIDILWKNAKVLFLVCIMLTAGLLFGLLPYAPPANTLRVVAYSIRQPVQRYTKRVEPRKVDRRGRMKSENVSITQPR